VAAETIAAIAVAVGGETIEVAVEGAVLGRDAVRTSLAVGRGRGEEIARG
jgi:ribosomal protein S11